MWGLASWRGLCLLLRFSFALAETGCGQRMRKPEQKQKQKRTQAPNCPAASRTAARIRG